MTVLTLELFLSIFLPVFLGVAFFLGGLSLNSLHNIDSKLGRIEPILALAYKNSIIEEYKRAEAQRQPDPPDDPPSEKERLLQKLEDNTITKEEAKKLKAILDKEAEDARVAGNIGLLLVILGLIALLAIIIASSQQ